LPGFLWPEGSGCRYTESDGQKLATIRGGRGRTAISPVAFLADQATVGDGARIDEGAFIGNHARIGARARIGAHAHVGDLAVVPPGRVVPARARVANESTWVCALGVDPWRGYTVSLCRMPDNTLVIVVGCRVFSLAEAKTHWGATYQGDGNAAWYRAVLQSVKAVAAAVESAPGEELRVTTMRV
jgi:carbonic anhydrase/acetyltransferase-like protein (isoleucine patch superfamily)